MLRLDGTLADLLPHRVHLMSTDAYVAYATGDVKYAEKKLQEWLETTMLGRVVKASDGSGNVVWLRAQTPKGPVWCLVAAPAPFDKMDVETAHECGAANGPEKKSVAA